MTLRVGSLFSGYGGLEIGIAQVLDAETVWHSENEAAPSRILDHHWPGVPNLGDVTRIDWAAAPPVDVICGGFPCQDVSGAGLRAGLRPGTRSGLWVNFAEAIDTLRPELVVIENVRGLLSAEAHSAMESDPWDLGAPGGSDRPALRALGAVLGDLADVGYDAEWLGLRAADAGAPHGRFRVFVLARPAADAGGDEPERRRERRDVGSKTPADEGTGRERERLRDAPRDRGAAAGDAGRVARDEGREGRPGTAPSAGALDHARGTWGPYGAAVERWERTLGRVAPSPTEAAPKGGERLSPRFVEWMMGLEPGHVTAPEIGLKRADQLKALGNGVVPQLAIRTLLS